MEVFSIIIPVYNRPEEIDDLLNSLTRQTYVHFEVIVVEDGSTIPAKEIVRRYQERLDLHYCVITNSGPGMARNHGARQRVASICSYWILTWYYPPRGLSIYTTRWIIIRWMRSVVRIRGMPRFPRSRRRSITPWPRPWRPVVPATRKRSWYIAYRHYSRFQSVYWLSAHSFAACFWCLLLFMPFYCL